MIGAQRESTTVFRSINPTTGTPVATYEGHSPGEVDAILADVAIAARKWQLVPFAERSKYLRSIAVKLREYSNRLAVTMAMEMGKPKRQGIAEVEKSAASCEFYAEHGEAFLADKKLNLAQAYIHYQPLGAVLAIMPWNFPVWQVLRCLCPILMAGNAMVLKHASNVMGCALLIEEIVEGAGVPRNVFRSLKISAKQVPAVIRHSTISAVTLTGSESAGKSVSAEAGDCLKPCVLELGGSDPFVVLDDADIEAAARTGAVARCQNSGQSCIAAKRFIIVASAYDLFVKTLSDAMKALKVGDPLLEETEVGPLARLDLRDELHDQVKRSVSGGASVVLGGSVPESQGAFYPPTIVIDARSGIPVFDEETFGPVAALVKVRNEAEAIAAANASRFGLGASIWTSNPERALSVAAQIDSGMVFVNQMTRSDPRLPFGGIKASGFGRELWEQGIQSFTNVKTIYCD